MIHNEIPQVVGKREIRSLIEGYVQSARNVKRSGLDGIELHGAHSYGIAQFLSPFYNRRTDEYGGSVRNRCRFAIEVAEAVRDEVGDFTMGLRLSFDEFVGEAGITGEQCEEILDILADTGLYDFFDMSGGNYHNLHLAVAPMSVPDGFMIPFGRRAKEVVGDRAKVFIVGRIRHIDMAADIVANGWADMVCMTRAHITDPGTRPQGPGRAQARDAHLRGAPTSASCATSSSGTSSAWSTRSLGGRRNGVRDRSRRSPGNAPRRSWSSAVGRRA